jgi:3-oxoacyl-[acyl-carrier protein] reductase
MMDDLLAEKSIFVTGGSRGIGRAVVESCMDHGATVGFTYLNSSESALEMVRGSEGACYSFRADSSSIDELRDAVVRFMQLSSGDNLDGLVVNAGVYERSPFSGLDIDAWRKTMDVNLDGAFKTVKAVLEFMRYGSMVLVSSQIAFKGSSSGADYSASKAGILGLSRSLARELAPDVRVNSVAPGYVDTDILAGDDPKKRKKRISEVPLGRIGDPREIAGPIVFLLSDLSSYVTGATLDINGGLFIH